MSTATLGFAIDSTPAARAATDLDGLVTAAVRTETAVEKMGSSVSRAVTRISGAGAQISQQLGKVANDTENLAKRIERALNIRTSFNGAERGKDIAAYGQELDRLRGKFNPVFTALSNYKTVLGEIRQAHKLGAISSDEMTAAISRERQAALASVQALKNRQQAMGGGAGNVANRRQVLGYQGFDVAQGLASGIPAQMILAQQGPQIAQLYAGQGGVKALLGDVGAAATGAVSAVGALPIALAAAGTAAVMYAKRNEVSLKSADTLLEKHRANIEALGTAYGVAERGARSYSAADRAVSGAATKGSLEDLNKLQVQSARELRLQFGSMQTPGKGGQAFFSPFPDFKPFADAFRDLDSGIRNGRIEGEKFIDTVSEISKVNPEYDKFANKILKAAQQFLEINTEVSKTKDILTQIAALPPLDPLGAFNPQREMDERAARTPSQFQQRQSRMDAYRQETMARSAKEREAAARATAAAQFDPNENPTDRENRIAMAGFEARLASERQLSDAQRERAANLNKMLGDQQSEIDLIGKTGGAAAALRKEYELISALKAEAARNGEQVDQAEIDAIKQKTAEYGKYVDLLNQRRFEFDFGKTVSDSRLSERDRQTVTTLRQYGMSEDLNSPNAGMIGKQYDWQQAKQSAKGFGDAFSSELISGSHNIGKSFLKGFESALSNSATKMWEKFFDGVGNLFADWVTGTKSGSSGAGGLTSVASTVLGAANDNKTFAAPVGAVTRAPLGNIASAAASIRKIESGSFEGNYGALGPITRNGDRAYGAYQVMGNNIGPWSKEALGKSMTASEFLTDKGAQDAIFKHKFGGYTEKYGEAGAAQAWFGGPGSVGKGGMGTDILGTSGNAYVEKFTTNIGKMGDVAGATTEGLGKLGGGLTKIGEGLSTSFFPAAPAAGGGGGGIGGWFSSLFGGGLSQATISKYTPLTGLFANGTDYAPGGMAMVGERGPELVNLTQGSGVVSNHKLMSALAANNNGGQGGGIAGIRVYFDQNGNLQAKMESVSRKEARSASGQAVGQYSKQQTRGGFGDTQSVYASDKG